jgi:2-polyprenyl-3-methyl-5-hydroxy-6-metoxy-1,4-benzoquinol methylase
MVDGWYGKKADEILRTTGAPNDMSSEDLRKAVYLVDYPQEFLKVVKTSREKFGWYTKHFPRIFEYPWLLNKLRGDLKDKKIADFGAGLSAMPIIFAEQGAIVTTIDNNSSIWEKSRLFSANEWGYFNYRELNNNINSLNLTMTKNTFPDDYFDVWYSISVVEHLPAELRREILKLIQKSLKRNGRLLLTFDLEKNTNRLWNYSEGKIVEETVLHGSLTDVEIELKKLGFFVFETRIIRPTNSEKIDLGLIDATLCK